MTGPRRSRAPRRATSRGRLYGGARAVSNAPAEGRRRIRPRPSLVPLPGRAVVLPPAVPRTRDPIRRVEGLQEPADLLRAHLHVLRVALPERVPPPGGLLLGPVVLGHALGVALGDEAADVLGVAVDAVDLLLDL